jgi:hypothetical protein
MSEPAMVEARLFGIDPAATPVVARVEFAADANGRLCIDHAELPAASGEAWPRIWGLRPMPTQLNA